MSNFVSDPTPQYRHAVGLLADLWTLDEDDDLIERAAAEVLQESRRRRQKLSDWKRSSCRCLRRVWGENCGERRCSTGYYCEEHRPPGADHDYMLHRDGDYRYVFQPYDLCWEDIRDLVKLCEKHGLRFDVSARDSDHFPGRTVEVTIRRKGMSDGTTRTATRTDRPEVVEVKPRQAAAERSRAPA